VYIELGDFRKAVESVEEGLQLALDTRQPNWTTGVTAVEAMVLGLTGDVEKALQRAAEVELSSSARVINDALCNAQLARGFAHLSAGRHADAFAALEPVFDPTDRRHHAREQFGGVMFLAEAAVHCDRVEDARPIIDRMEQTAMVTSSPVLATKLLYARAVLADDAVAERLFEAGLAEDLTRWPWTRARIQLAYGIWLRRQRRVAESREPLSAALSTFDLIGATAWAEEARSELRATGARRAADDFESGVAHLSSQELRIARLAAEGMSNREIGQQLYLSPRTVGSHLYRMFPKLGIRNRAQLSARLEVGPLTGHNGPRPG
jgi:DNA-binding CsgD family transcriptional regulator